MDINEYCSSLSANTGLVISTVEPLTSELFNFQQKGRWSILQVLEHVYLTDKMVHVLLKTSGEASHSGESIYGNDKLQRILSMRRRAVDAPSSLKPSGAFSSVIQWKESISSLRENLIHDLKSAAITIDNRIYQHPVLGAMTSSDWLYMIIHHTNRHLEQIREIIDLPKGNS